MKVHTFRSSNSSALGGGRRPEEGAIICLGILRIFVVSVEISAKL